MDSPSSKTNLAIEQSPPGVMLIRLTGDWRAQRETPSSEHVRQALDQASGVKSLLFEAATLTGWDSRFVAFVRNCAELCRMHNVELRDEGLPEGIRRLLRLAQTVPERKDARRAVQSPSLLQGLGEHALKARESGRVMFAFFGENVIALGNLLRGRAQYRWSDAFLAMQECGPQGLGIVAMINFLVGLILAFVGAVELKRFGASIYVADLVGIATVREMGCI